MGQIDDVSLAVTMDAKQAGNLVYQIGATKSELGGSHLSLVRGLAGGQVPTVDPPRAKATFAALHQAIRQRQVRACHDLSEGGLAVAATEMAMAGGLGMKLDLDPLCDAGLSTTEVLFSESNSRFLIEVEPQHAESLEAGFAEAGVPLVRLGTMEPSAELSASAGGQLTLEVSVAAAKAAWQSPLDW